MTTTENKPNALFWVIAVIALLWNAMGIMNYLAQVMMTPEMLDNYGELERALMENRPAWATGAFAIAVFSGSLAAILLLLRKKMAYSVFNLSFIAVMVHVAYGFMASSSLPEFNIGTIGLMLIVPAFSILEIVYTKRADAKGWLN